MTLLDWAFVVAVAGLYGYAVYTWGYVRGMKRAARLVSATFDGGR